MAATAQSPGAASRIQLAARGPQDVYVFSGDATAWRVGWRRHAPFLAKIADVSMDYLPGKRSVVDLPKSGDVLADVTLEVTLPAVGSGHRWIPQVGHAMLRRVRLLIDDAEVHNYERLWYDIYDALHVSAGHRAGLRGMLGADALPADAPRVLYIPLRFLTARKGMPRPSLPLLAMPRARIALDVEFEKLEVLMPTAAVDPGAIRVRVLCDVVEVDEPEQARLLRPTTLAYESVIDSDGLSYRVDSDGDVIDSTTIDVDLSRVTKTVKYLAWVGYEERATSLFTYLPSPLRGADVLFDGSARERYASSPGYFTLYQRYARCRGCSPTDGVGVYSFALDASSRHGTGAADFAQLKKPVLRGFVSRPTPRFKLKVFAAFHNYLDVANGTARVVFT